MGMLPMVVNISLMAFRRVIDHHVSNTAGRPLVVAAIAVIVIAGATIMVVNAALTELTALVVTGLVVVIVSGGITATTSYKVSFHAAVAWGARRSSWRSSFRRLGQLSHWSLRAGLAGRAFSFAPTRHPRWQLARASAWSALGAFSPSQRRSADKPPRMSRAWLIAN
jgi:hypothetical protein